MPKKDGDGNGNGKGGAQSGSFATTPIFLNIRMNNNDKKFEIFQKDEYYTFNLNT